MQAGSSSCRATSAAIPTFTAPLPGAWPSLATRPATFPRSWPSCGGGWTGPSPQEDVQATAALVCLVDAIKHGTTTLIDHHASPSALAGSLDADRGGCQRGWLASQPLLRGDRSQRPRRSTGRHRGECPVSRAPFRRESNPLLAASFGLHASLTLSDETLADCVAAVAGAGHGLSHPRRRGDLGPGGQPAHAAGSGSSNGSTMPASWAPRASWSTACTWTPGRWRSCATPAPGSPTSRAPT